MQITVISSPRAWSQVLPLLSAEKATLIQSYNYTTAQSETGIWIYSDAVSN